MATLDTVMLITPDAETLSAFYVAALGIDSEPKRVEGHVGYQLGPIYLGFDEVQSDADPPGKLMLWFTVDDVDAVWARCIALGGTGRTPPGDQPWGGRGASVLDPEGNHLGFTSG